jgi:ATP-dependent 26S proteasome regulatory subunit
MSDFLFSGLLISSLQKISTSNVFLDLGLMFVFTILINYMTSKNGLLIVKNYMNKCYNKYHPASKYNIITFNSNSDSELYSTKYKAIIHHISHIEHPSIKHLIENEIRQYNPRNDRTEVQNTVYRVDQSTKFRINDLIEGDVSTEYEDKETFGSRIISQKIFILNLYSKKLSLQQMMDWIDAREVEYKTFLKNKHQDSQLMIEIKQTINNKKCDLDLVIEHNEWASNVTFENRFFTDKEEIISKIDFFLNNHEWYRQRGIPYTIGFLLWGEPGCGKTGFIKALMNKTKRHAIDVKLNNEFDFTKLRDIIYGESIGSELIIPQEKRILIFEDIDAMGSIVKSRDIKEPEKIVNKEKKENDSDNEKDVVVPYRPKQNLHNNLSYLLNILDGLQECPGRIIIMTTNKPEVLDKALIRSGRIDFKINFTKATRDDLINILAFYWKVNKESFSSQITEDMDKQIAHADIVNMCRTSDNVNETIDKIQNKITNIDSEEFVI